MRIIVTGGAVIQDQAGRILMQRRSDYGDWGLPGGAMEPGETIEETMRREVMEETGLVVLKHELMGVYSGPRMQYTYPDGNEVVFVMFIFKAEASLQGSLSDNGRALLFQDIQQESLQLEFKSMDEIEQLPISSVQQPVFEDLMQKKVSILRS
ncbi:DNA mismatch repair protein MutT [Paenibacillus sp. SSG-1]|uniref:DNA mismatch repair protein MutT n=1 Tax=Paenibacillus cineris TaxID=237530 RepID=A0ABQ4L6S0_9BACL|nr:MULTISPECIES: NUDIX domain-containing protein [Paenibacillus]OXL81814.1 DNA mismatch repair protein MutT [Paenibacillus sp. SSG-1]GIO52083.1 DNA mismatch repair protein MutT [Paenibacillus cineris]GIO63788.1 DNA mismatch repair protein MutT [Paenibacillus cineris]